MLIFRRIRTKHRRFWVVLLMTMLFLARSRSSVRAFQLSPLPFRRSPSSLSQQQQQQQQSFLTRHYLMLRNGQTKQQQPTYIKDKNNKSNLNNKNSQKKVPYLIEQLPAKVSPAVFQEIAEMCITAFFDALPEQKSIFKEFQLAYLRKLQTNDLDRRRRRDTSTTSSSSNPNNMMFVAYRVVPASDVDPHSARKKPLILDFSRVYNLKNTAEHNNVDDDDYIRGEILGFVEVTKRPYGLGDLDNYNNNKDADDDSSTKSTEEEIRLRPVLTNLSVRESARGCGVGSALLDLCERSVQATWPESCEIILEVEDDNDTARHFYHKRGYATVYEDPASRRYDTSGLLLQQVSCRRHVMRKKLLLRNNNANSISNRFLRLDSLSASSGLGSGNVLQRLRDNVFATVLAAK